MSPVLVRGLTGLTVFGLLCVLAPAQEDPYATWALERSESPYLYVEDGDRSVDHFPLEATDVSVRIDGVLAEVRVRQRYRNEGERPLSVRYVFPASLRAAVHGMSMTLDERVIEARIAERQAARQVYEEAKEEGRGAALLEQERPNVFQMQVANVLAGEELAVELVYSEFLVPEDGIYEFVFPTVVGPRYTGEPAPYDGGGERAWTANPFLGDGEPPTSTLSIDVDIAAGLPLAELACSSHETRMEWTGASAARVALDPAEPYGGDRDFVLRYRLAGERIQTGLMLQRGEGDEVGHLLLTVQPPARVTDADVPPREYVFVLDVSGSMSGRPLDVARRLLRELVGSLRPSDSFNVVLFAGDSSLLAPASLPATDANVRRAQEFAGDRSGGGGTELAAALHTSLALPRTPGVSRSLLVITDGFISAEAEAFRLVHENIAGTNVFAFGVGDGVNRYLVEGLARAGQGEAVVVSDAVDAHEAVDRFRDYVSQPVLTDIALHVDGLQLLDQDPERLADLMAARPLVVSGRWRGAPTGTLRVTGRSAAGPFEQVVDVAAVSVATDGALPWLWARERVAALADWNFGEPTPDQEREILALGLEYGLLTDFTSFVAVSQDVRTDGSRGDEVVQPLPLPKEVTSLALGYGAGGGDEPALLVLAALVLLLLLARQAWTRRLDGSPA